MFSGSDLDRTDPARHLIPAAYDLDYISVDDLSTDDLSVDNLSADDLCARGVNVFTAVKGVINNDV